MKKYTIIRFISMIVNLFIVLTFMYFALSFAKYAKYTDLPFKEYLEYTYTYYKIYIKDIYTSWNWGNALDGTPVMEVLRDRIPISLKINLVAFAIYFPAGIFFGVIAALFRDTFIDRVIGYITMVLGSIPTYIMMFLLVMYVGFFWEIVHYSYNPYEQLLIPVIALILPPIATFIRVIRGEIIESLTAEYLLLARTKGLTQNQAILKHTFKNSFVAVLPEIPTAFLYALTGSFLVELIYHIPGVAELMYDSLVSISPMQTNYVNIDIPVVMVITLFYTGLSFIVIFICDLLHRVIDPRINMTDQYY